MDVTPNYPWMQEKYYPIKTDNKTQLMDTSDFDIKKGYKESDDKMHIEYDWDFLEAQMKRMGTNKSKYGINNWKKPMDIEALKASLFRHTLEIMKDNYKDEQEYGHLLAIALNAMFIHYQLINKIK